MAIYLLDTSVIIDTINGKRHRGQFLKGLLHQGHLLACCETRISELLHSLLYYPIIWPTISNTVR